jgi:hypothetical protein
MKFIDAVLRKVGPGLCEHKDVILATLEAALEEAKRLDLPEAIAFLEIQISELRPPKPPEVRLAEIVSKLGKRILVSPDTFRGIKKLAREILEREKGKSQ